MKIRWWCSSSTGTLRTLLMGNAGFQSEKQLLAQGVDLHADVSTSRRLESGSSRFGFFIECCARWADGGVSPMFLNALRSPFQDGKK
jgi:hypothetical protein